MQITDVRVKRLNTETRLKAVASITIDNAFAIHEIKVINGDNGLFVTMPSRQTADGSYKDIAHPVNAETRKIVEEAVLNAYEKADIAE